MFLWTIQTELNFLLLQVFSKLRHDNPEVFEKAIPIKGDVMKPRLGLSDEDIDLLSAEVSVVFHSAATVNFDEPMRVALQMNVLGTKRILELSRKMKNLVVSVDVGNHNYT